jgi:hypothetical protein
VVQRNRCRNLLQAHFATDGAARGIRRLLQVPQPTHAATIDCDSTIIEVHGHHKQGASYGYTRQLGYHPLLAARADTGEVLHARLRPGRAHTARGMPRFVDELLARLRRAGATGELIFRADSGFWSATTIKRLRRHRVRYWITVRHTKPVRQAIAATGPSP